MNKSIYRVGSYEIGNIYLEYYIVRGTEINDYTGCFEWGIKIIKYISGRIDESEEIKNISSDYNKTVNIAEILRKNSVTPIGVKYALEDML